MTESNLPEPGQQAAPDADSEGVHPAVEVKGEGADRTVTSVSESSVGPGAGEGDLVTVTAPVQRQGDPVTSHPTLRGTTAADDDSEDGEPAAS